MKYMEDKEMISNMVNDLDKSAEKSAVKELLKMLYKMMASEDMEDESFAEKELKKVEDNLANANESESFEDEMEEAESPSSYEEEDFLPKPKKKKSLMVIASAKSPMEKMPSKKGKMKYA
jgi:hypothetical protein